MSRSPTGYREDEIIKKAMGAAATNWSQIG